MADSKVVHIGDFGIARKSRGWLSQKASECKHKQVELDDNGHIVKCLKCGEAVSANWYLSMLAAEWQNAEEVRAAKDARLAADLAAGLTLQAAKRVEEAWRRRGTMPTCPHCHRGISQHDRFGSGMISRDLENRRREIEAKQKQSSTDGGNNG